MITNHKIQLQFLFKSFIKSNNGAVSLQLCFKPDEGWQFKKNEGLTLKTNREQT